MMVRWRLGAPGRGVVAAASGMRALALLALAGAATALFAQELFSVWLDGFISANTLPLEDRGVLLASLGGGAAVGALAGAIAWAKGAAVDRLAHLCAPAILLGFIPPLCSRFAWPDPVKQTIVLAGFLLLAERLFRMSFAAACAPRSARLAAPHTTRLVGGLGDTLSGIRLALTPLRWAPWLPGAAVLAGALGYAIYMSVFALFMHGRFQTYNFDLGQFDNLFYNALHGHPLRCTPLNIDQNWQDLRNHADLVTFFLLPIYAVKPGAPTLLVIQATVLGLGAIPLYRFAARRLPPAYAAVIAFAYLLYPPMHGLQFFDIHFQPMATLFVLLVIDFVDEGRYVPCTIAFVIALSCREDIPVGLAILGTFLALSGRRVTAGLIMAVAATGYFVAMRFFIMPSFGHWGFEDTYKDLFPPGSPTFGGVILTMLTNPTFTVATMLTAEKLQYALQVLLPVAFLPVRRTALVVSIVAGSIFTILTTAYPPTIDIAFQYSAHFLPYIFPATALCLSTFRGSPLALSRRRAALAALIAGTVLCDVHWGAFPPRATFRSGYGWKSMRAPNAAERQKHRDLVELHALVPANASLAMTNVEMTHVSHLVMRTLTETGNTADYLLYGTDAGDGPWGERAVASGEYEKVAERANVVLARRKHRAPTPQP